MLTKKKWMKEFKRGLIKEAILPFDRNIMISWVLIMKSYETLTPGESVNECIDFMFGDVNGPDFA